MTVLSTSQFHSHLGRVGADQRKLIGPIYTIRRSTTLTVKWTHKTSFICWWNCPPPHMNILFRWKIIWASSKTSWVGLHATPLSVSLCCWWDEKQEPGMNWKQYNVSRLLHGLIYSEKPASAHPEYFSEHAGSDLSAHRLLCRHT